MWKGNTISVPDNVSSSVRFTGHLTSQMLSKYMACAFALVYVPYFEGFGLPCGGDGLWNTYYFRK